MILVIGDRADPVVSRVSAALARIGVRFVSVNESSAPAYRVEMEADGGGSHWHIRGGDCTGRRRVGAIFVRHAVRAPARSDRKDLEALQQQLDELLLATPCQVVNRPACAGANYSKPYQLRQLAAAGFLVPSTLVTNLPQAARHFAREHGARVIFKGISSVKTDPQALQLQHLERLSWLKRCPTQFQEFIPGEDIRVTVVDASAVVTRCVQDGQDARLAAESALAPEVVERCIRFTHEQGLVMGGIDLRQTPEGRIYAFELNPYPLFTHHETVEQPRVTERVVAYLLKHQHTEGDVFA